MNDRITARAVYFTKPYTVEVRREPIRACEGEVLVHSTLLGISHGTEACFFAGDFPRVSSADGIDALEGKQDYPLKYGYMAVGTAEHTGRIFTFYPHQDRFYLDPAKGLPLPDDISDEDAVFIPSMETALGIVHDAAPRHGEVILIIGLGSIGLLVTEILRIMGFSQIVTCDPLEMRRRKSAELDCCVVTPQQMVEKTLTVSSGIGVDCAINLSGSSEGLQGGLDALAFEGRLIEASWYGTKKVEIMLGTAFHRKRLCICSSQVSHIDAGMQPRWNKERRMKAVMELLGKIRPAKYITHRFSLEEAQNAFDTILNKPGEVIQVVLKP